jgi:hypothetical protein
MIGIVVALATLIPVFLASAAKSLSVADLSGSWHGTSRFTGISFQEATQKDAKSQNVEISLRISADGKVTGRVGSAELQGWANEANRGWLGRLLHMKTNFVIAGTLAGSVISGSEAGTHAIKIPIAFEGSQVTGSIFAVYPLAYPYPFLRLQLSR